jgi:L-ribulose-5-phosphate 3-epimerase
MIQEFTRRSFIGAAGAAAIGATALSSASKAVAGEFTGKIKKAVKFGMIKGDMPVMDKFKLVKDLGFDGVEPSVKEKVDHAEMVKASEATGIPIHGTVNGSVENIGAALDLAQRYGSTSVLVCAGRVDANSFYADNYRISQEKIRAAVPKAQELKIRLLVENVWNNFLVSPLEMARYIDEINSEWVGVYFDVGNVVRFGWPEHWIAALGPRIHKLDIKEYSRDKQNNEGLWKGFQVKIGEGSVDWAAVRKELVKINYTGWATAEVGGGGRERLADISARMDRVLDL